METKMKMPPTDPTEIELMALLEPVFSNTYWIENALGMIEGIAKHAAELNGAHGHFFALIHQFSVDFIVLGICKLFDRTKDHPIHTIPALMNFLKEHFTDTYVSRLDTSTLIDLGVSDADANRIITEFKTISNFTTTKTELITILKKKMRAYARPSAIKHIFLYRNKVAAHQEALTDALKDQLKDLPSIDEIEKVNKWASDFCRFVACAMTNTTLLRNPSGARIAALNVVAKVLGKGFESSTSGFDYQEREAFYSRL